MPPDYSEHSLAAFRRIQAAEDRLLRARLDDQRFGYGQPSYFTQAYEQQLHNEQHRWHRLQTSIESNTYTSANAAQLIAVGRGDLASSSTVNRGMGVRPAPFSSGTSQLSTHQAAGDSRYTYGDNFNPLSNVAGGTGYSQLTAQGGSRPAAPAVPVRAGSFAVAAPTQPQPRAGAAAPLAGMVPERHRAQPRQENPDYSQVTYNAPVQQLSFLERVIKQIGDFLKGLSPSTVTSAPATPPTTGFTPTQPTLSF